MKISKIQKLFFMVFSAILVPEPVVEPVRLTEQTNLGICTMFLVNIM